MAVSGHPPEVWAYGPVSFRRAVTATRVGFSLYHFAGTDEYDERVWPR